MPQPIPTDEQKQQMLKERIADKEALKEILRKYDDKFAHRLIGAAMTDLDLEP